MKPWGCYFLDCYHITGGNPLEGTYQLKGAKNSVLPIMAACVLTNDVCILENCPDLSDVDTMVQILRELGCSVFRESQRIIIDSKTVNCDRVSKELGGKLRSSIFLMGPMLARFGSVTICRPGGCAIGERPIDLHISSLRALGAEIEERIERQEEEIICRGERLKGTVVHLIYPSVGATENVMMAATMAEGVTRILGGAKEPEIEDLQNFLNHCGARIRGAGTDEIVIEGGRSLHGTGYTVIPDRIETGTMLAACAVTGGNLCLQGARSEQLSAVIDVLIEMGCCIRSEGSNLWIAAPERLHCVPRIETLPYPGFPTDLQSAILTALAVADGQGELVETVFESRFKTVEDLKKMGAKIEVQGRTATVKGVKALTGAEVEARDLRGGAALVIAGLAAKGETVVKNICHIDRGYDRFEVALRALGAQIERKK